MSAPVCPSCRAELVDVSAHASVAGRCHACPRCERVYDVAGAAPELVATPPRFPRRAGRSLWAPAGWVASRMGMEVAG